MATIDKTIINSINPIVGAKLLVTTSSGSSGLSLDSPSELSPVVEALSEDAPLAPFRISTVTSSSSDGPHDSRVVSTAE